MKIKLILVLTLFSLLLQISSSTVKALIVFSDSFINTNETKLSDHNPKWIFSNEEPQHVGRWGEFQIHSNSAGDGDGDTFSSNKLDVPLSSHFKISLDFIYNPEILDDTFNQHFIDIRLRSVSQGDYLFRFWLQPENTGSTLTEYDPHSVRQITQGNYNFSGNNSLSIEYNSGLITVTLNEVEILSFSDTTLDLTPDRSVLAQSVNTALITDFELNDLTIPDATPTPTPVPTPEPTPNPTPEPTPIPTPTPFPITHYSQRDPAWKNHIYDSANIWAPRNSNMERWGCAVTSASTILDYYGIQTLPNNEPLNPGTLNAWLKTQPDGFIRQGYLNWNAISRVSKLASNINPSLPSLEYKSQGNNQTDLQAHLNAAQPVILETPGHFITAYQFNSDTNTTNIVDPFWGSTRPTLSSYGNTFTSMRTFTPSHTNLGQIIVSSDQNVTPSLYYLVGSTATVVPTAYTQLQQPIIDQTSTPFSPNLSPFQLLEYAKPASGTYQVRLHRDTPGLGSAEIYTYDIVGTPTVIPTTNIFTNSDIIFTITYNATGSAAIKKKVDFTTLTQDIQTAKAIHAFKHKYNGKDLLALLDVAKKLYPRNKKSSKHVMEAFRIVLRARKHVIDSSTYTLISDDLKLVFAQLY